MTSLSGKPPGTDNYRNYYIKFGWELAFPEPKNDNFPSAVKVKVVAILSMMSLLGKSLSISSYHLKKSKIDKLFLSYTTNHYIKFERKLILPEPKNGTFYTSQTGSHIVHEIIGNPLVTQNAMQKWKNGTKYWNFLWWHKCPKIHFKIKLEIRRKIW